MKKILNWKKGLLKNTYEIFDEQELIGKLKERNWTQAADGEAKGKKYSFKTKGILNPVTEITEDESKTVIGRISYNSWKTRANIELNNTTMQWKYDNIWNTKWSLFTSENILVSFHGSYSKGKIEFDEADYLHVLTGLFITNYYRETYIAIMVAVFIPIWITVIN